MGVLLSTWMRVVSSPCWIYLTSLGRFCSPQTNYHLPKDIFCVTSIIERGADGDVCRANPTIVERCEVNDKSHSIQGTIWCHLHQVLPDPKRCSRSPMGLTQQPQVVSGVPSGVGLPTAFLQVTFQSSFFNVSHGLLCQQPSGKARAEAGGLVSCTHCKAHSCGLLLGR